VAELALESPIGNITVTEQSGLLASVRFGDRQNSTASSLLEECAAQLAAYFAGKRFCFGLPPVAASTNFQALVGLAMQAVGFGKILTYGAVADAVGGNPRAVGQACGCNPVPIIVPCHRIFAA